MRFTTNIQPTMWDMAQIYRLSKRKTLYDDKPWNVWVPCFQTNPNIMHVLLYPSISSNWNVLNVSFINLREIKSLQLQ